MNNILSALLIAGIMTLMSPLPSYSEDNIKVAILAPAEAPSLDQVTLDIGLSNATSQPIVVQTIERDPPVTVIVEGDDGMQFVVRGSDYLTKSGKSVGRKGGTKNREFALGANDERDYSKSIPELLGKGEHLNEPRPGTIVNIYVLFTEVFTAADSIQHPL